MIEKPRTIIILCKYLPLLVVTGSLLPGCTRQLDIDIPQPEPRIVVEGWIEQGKPARVILTQSVPFFSDLDSLSLTEIPITHAKVTLITDTGHEVLTLKPNTSYFPPYVYNSTDLKGIVNSQYRLEVEYQGEKLTAFTTIPEPAYLDTVWFAPEPGYDSLGRIWIQFTDNPATVDYYRILTQTRGRDPRYIPSYISTISDRYFSGESIVFGLLRGMGSVMELGDSRLYRMGDTVNIKFCTLDKEHYEFWNSVQTEIITSSNPFASSYETIQSNIFGGYGIWGGYGASYYTTVAE